MFAVIPLAFIFLGAAGIGYIVWPKIKELKQREEPPEAKEDFWHSIFPEIFGFLNSAVSRWSVLKSNALADYEKFLRRVKIISLKTHNLSDKLLEKKQKNGKAASLEFKEIDSFSKEQAANAQFKIKEDNLIIEIAKNPKEKNLYKTLGAFYLENEMFSDAKDVFNVVLELDPNDLEAKERVEKIGSLS